MICAVTFSFVVMVNVTKLTREGVLSAFLYADYSILISETIEGLRNMFSKWKEAFETNGLKDNVGNTKVMVSGGITKDGLSKSTFYPCVVCCLRVKDSSFLFVQCGKWMCWSEVSDPNVFKKFCLQYV